MIKKQFLKFLLLIILFFYLTKFTVYFNKNKEKFDDDPITTMKTIYNEIKENCSSDGINCSSKDAYIYARAHRIDQCKKSIRDLKNHCLNNPSIINKRKCKRVFYWKWRRNQRRKLPKNYDNGCYSTTG